MSLEERLNTVEKKLVIQESMINHLNNLLKDNIMNKIEIDFETMMKANAESLENTAANNGGYND
jgi:uncharacterized coiled-coil protein SlyX